MGQEHLVHLGPHAREQGVKEEADEVGKGLKAWLRWLGVALAGVGGLRWGSEQVGRAGQGRARQSPFESNSFAGKTSCRAWQPGREGGVKERPIPLAGAVMAGLTQWGLNHLVCGKSCEALGQPSPRQPLLTGHCWLWIPLSLVLSGVSLPFPTGGL